MKIIKSNDKKILVKAGAGTGKTEILTRRILRLIEDNPTLSINDMAIITFTNKATDVLIERIKKIFYSKWSNEKDPVQKQRFRFELEMLNSAHIFTIHQFCKTILQTFGPYYDDQQYINYSPSFSVRSNRLSDIIQSTIESWIQNKREKKMKIKHLGIMPIHKLIEIIKTIYDLIRSKGLDLRQVITKTYYSALQESNEDIYPIKQELLELIEEVHTNVFKNKYDRIDADDLLENCAKLLQNRPDLREMIQKRYQHIFIDEFQDTSLHQAQIIKLICGHSTSPSLFVVGDIKQSVYQFRGADPDSYTEIEQWIKKEGTVLSLTTNWRSTPEIIHYVNTIFDNLKNDRKYTFNQEHLKPSHPKPTYKLEQAYEWILAENNNDQNKLLALHLKTAKDQGQNLNQFTILVRYNDQLLPIANELDKHSVPYNIVDSGNFYNQREIIDTYRVLKSIIDENNAVAIHESKNTIFFAEQQELLHVMMDDIYRNQLIYRYTPSQMINYICQKTNIYSRCTPQTRANLNKLKEKTRQIVKDEKISLYHYIDWLSNMIHGNVDEPLADIAIEEKNAATLMTIHKAKGLEFPFVILPHLDRGFSKKSLNPEVIIDKENLSLEFRYQKYYESCSHIQSQCYDNSLKKMQFQFFSEELRVLYVALTRAKEKLILFGSSKCKKEKECYQNWLLRT